MNDIFKNAKFGDMYITKCGLKASYVGMDCAHILAIEGQLSTGLYYDDGRCTGMFVYDIVGRINEEI